MLRKERNVNRTFNLPSIQGSRTVTGTTTSNDIGYTDVGVLPNITGKVGCFAEGGTDGAFYPVVQNVGAGAYYGNRNVAWMDASRSSNIYNSNYQEVQPKRILMYFIIKYI